MPRAKSEAEKTTAQSETVEETKPKKKASANGGVTSSRSASSAKTKASKDNAADVAPRRRAAPPAPTARPSIYDTIAQSASKAEADRAAKAAARKAAQATQSALPKAGAVSPTELAGQAVPETRRPAAGLQATASPTSTNRRNTRAL